MISIYAVPTLLPFVGIFFFKFSLILWIYDIIIKMNTKNKIDFKIRYLDITKKEWQMRKDTKNFIKSADYDLKTAEFMLNSGRYPEDFSKIIKAYPENIAEEYLSKTKEILECLKKHEMLKE